MIPGDNYFFSMDVVKGPKEEGRVTFQICILIDNLEVLGFITKQLYYQPFDKF